jgi:hypothetical protein
MSTYRNILSLDHDSKGIPYGGSGEPRADGEANYGFKDIKSKLELLPTIPELARDAALLELVRAISLPSTGLFSIGCLSSHVADKQGVRRTGYVEFAFNSAAQVQDASNYFPLYFHFDRTLKQSKFSGKVQYQWELKPAMFLDAQIGGFTCSVFLNTFYSATEQEAESDWALALRVLMEFLASVPAKHGDLLYGT